MVQWWYALIVGDGGAGDLVTIGEAEIGDDERIAWMADVQAIHRPTPGEIGQDCIKLNFNINENSQLEIEGIDLRNNNAIESQNLGKIR